MKLTEKQIKRLKDSMIESRKKGNIATAAIVLNADGELIDSAESLVASDCDATAHSELTLVSRIGRKMKSNYTPGLIMITVLEPCLMCMSACSQAGYDKIYYIVPAERFLASNPLMTDVNDKVNKKKLAQNFSDPVELIHLERYEEEFSKLFEELIEKYEQIPPKG
jgi:tRNA(Arg) A34 adenosine deaminase TadA